MKLVTFFEAVSKVTLPFPNSLSVHFAISCFFMIFGFDLETY